MAALFRPIKQTTRNAGGAGLGLYSLAKRVEALGGYYGVEHNATSSPGGSGARSSGCLFWFTIPYRPDYLASQFAGNKPCVVSLREFHAAQSGNVLSYGAAPEKVVGPASAHSPPQHGVVTRVNSSNNNSGHGPHIASQSTTPNTSHKHHGSSGLSLHPPPSDSKDAEEEEEEEEQRRYSPEPGTPMPAVMLNILLVDDAPSILKMAGMMLSRHGERTVSVQLTTR